jgi:hypothetical protein
MITDPSKQVKLGFVSGLVPREKSMAFERILFRATRGNVFLKQAVVEDSVIDPVSGEKVSPELVIINCQLLDFWRGCKHVLYHALCTWWGNSNKPKFPHLCFFFVLILS